MIDPSAAPGGTDRQGHNMFTFTDMAVDYSVDELDDLTDRKVAPEGIDGDRLARIIRARRGTARATGKLVGHGRYTADETGVRYCYCGRTEDHTDGNRRMAAVGISDRSALAWTDGTDIELGIPSWTLVTY